MASIYDAPADLNLINTYVPLPFEEMARGLDARQQRYDTQAARIDTTAQALGSIESAGLADNAYMMDLKDQYARDVVEEFPYGEVDLTDPTVSSRLNKRISQFSNDPNLKLIQSNQQLYAPIKSAVQSAAIKQGANPWNWAPAAEQLMAFETEGSRAVGNLADIAIPEPADVYGTLAKVVNDFKASGMIKEDDITAIRQRRSAEGVGLPRLRHAFGLNPDTGKAKEVPFAMRQTDVGQEVLRAAEYYTPREEGETPQEYDQRVEAAAAELYSSAISNYIEAYAWNKTEEIDGLGSLLKLNDKPFSGRLTLAPSSSARGLNGFNELKSRHNTGFISGQIMEGLKDMVFGKEGEGRDITVDRAIGDIYNKHLGTKVEEGIVGKPAEQAVNEALDASRDEFRDKMSGTLIGALVGPFSLGASSPDAASRGVWGMAEDAVNGIYKKAWKNMVEHYSETLFDVVALTSPEFDSSRHLIENEDAQFTLMRVRSDYDQMNGPDAFNNLSPTDRADVLNKMVFDHMAELRQVYIEVPSEREESADYNKNLSNSLFGIDEPSYVAEKPGHARGTLAGATAFKPDGEEVKFSDMIDKGSMVNIVGKLADNNPYGPGFFEITIDGEPIYVQGNMAERDAQYLDWHLYGYDRSFSGISQDEFNATHGDVNYKMRTVDDPQTGKLRIDYKKPGDRKWSSYQGTSSDIGQVYEELTSILN